MKHIAIILMILSNPCKGERIFFNDGNSLEAKILEANETHVRIERAKDHQQFKFEISLLTKDSQKQIELYHSKGRYSSIPSSETPLDKKTLEGYASYIDKLINEGLRSKKLQKTKELNNEAYARRIYLTLIGRIPTKLELNTFLNNRSPEGKGDLVQKLLNSTGHINHQMNWWSDMLRVKDRINGVNINIGSVYRHWLRNAISHNKPYDQTVRELIGSSGRVYEDEQGAAISYFLRDRGMQEDNLSHTIRIFLGTRLQCAMCHDHPFDRWTQKQFYEMTAFTSGIGNVRLKEPGKAINELTKAIREDSDERAGLFNNWRNQIRDLIIFGIENNGTGEIKLPKDFVEDNGNPGDIVLAKAIFTPKPIIETKAESPNSRIALAKWITSKNNPRFTTMIANRIWKQVFGVGLIEPIDTMMDDTIASNTDLMKYIEKIMVSLNYDIREFQRVLVSTELFQRESKKHDHKSLENYSFEGPLLRRMTGEQLWDSLVTLVYNDIDEENRVYLHNQQDYSILFNKYKHMSGKEMYEEIKRLADENPGERNFAKLNKLDEHLKDMKKFKDRNLVRSSYLQSPAPGGHLIRQFGGADREQIDNSNKEPNTPQVLNLLNGFVETNILNKKDADFMSQIQSESIKNKQIESAFLSILSRKPTIKETSYLKKLINKKDGFKHIAWVLLNSHEFIFIR
tara:strand:+ start:1037 stop:3088 length:2052 start_codon:yes stop_codon:yes gene_type:complete